MTLRSIKPLAYAATLGALAISAPAALAEGTKFTASADLQNPDGEQVGTVNLTQVPDGVLMAVMLEGLPEGTHAFHIHETGKCEPPFKSAGGHFNPTEAEHGLLNEAGMHAGDLPNIVMPEGKLELQYFNPRVSLIEGNENNLLDEDGAAIVIHRGAHDYESNPAGKAGKRIACGVLDG